MKKRLAKSKICLLGTLLLCLTSYGQYVDVTKPPYYAIPNDNKDDTAGIQKAIDRNPGKTIFIPAGTFNIDKSIVIGHAVEIIGEGISNTIFSPLSCNGFLIKSSNVTIKNMFIKGNENSSNAFTGILAYGQQGYGLYGLHIERVQLQNMSTGIELRYTSGAIMDKVKITMNPNQATPIREGIRFYGKCVNNIISNCHISSAVAGIAIRREKTNEEKTRIDKPDDSFGIIDLKSQRAEGLIITNSFIRYGKYGIYSEGILRMNVSNCSIDLSDKTAIDATMTDELLFSSNYISSNSNVPNPVIKLSNCSYGNISNNNINSVANNNLGISFENDSKNCVVIGNTIKGVQYKTHHSSGSKNNTVTNNH